MAPHLSRTVRFAIVALLATVVASCSDAEPTSQRAGALADVCNPTIAIQTDWYPQAEHGGIYELLGTDYVVDATAGTTTGALIVDGVDSGVDLQIRAGGPFIESPVVTEMFLDDTIMFGYVGTDVAISRYAETPTLAVFNALTINPQIILWNADKHPQVSTIAEVAQEVPAVSVFGDRPYMRYLVEQGIVPADKVDTNYKGNLLLATDDIAHQGFATSEPYRYRTLESGAIATAYQLVHDAGWTSYPQNLAVNKLRVEELSACLAALVPVMQQAQINFIGNPERTITTIVDVVAQLNTSWSQTPELARYAVDTIKQLGIVGNGTTTTFGDFESPRIDDFIALATPILRQQGLNIPEIQASDLATNEFLDLTITQP